MPRRAQRELRRRPPLAAAAGRRAPGRSGAARCCPGSRRLPFPPISCAASRDPGRKFVARAPVPVRALLRGPQALPWPERGGHPVLQRAWPRFGGAQRRRVWRPQTPPYDAAAARELREHAPGAAGALPRAGPGGGWVSRGRHSAGRVRLQLEAEGRPWRQVPARASAGSGRGVCPQALSRPLSGCGLDPGDRNRSRGTIVPWL